MWEERREERGRLERERVKENGLMGEGEDEGECE